jgi:hypothetical protein
VDNCFFEILFPSSIHRSRKEMLFDVVAMNGHRHLFLELDKSHIEILDLPSRLIAVAAVVQQKWGEIK